MRISQVRYLLPLLALLLLVAGLSSAQAKSPWIGVYMQDINEELAEAFDLKVTKGVLINDIVDDSPADEAGLRRGDVILTWGGDKVLDTDMLVDLVADSEVGDKAELLVLRDGDEQDIALVIGEEDWPLYGRNFSEKYLHVFGDDFHGGIGVSLQSLSGDLGEYFGVEDGDGALITEVHEDTPAEEAGLQAGDVIVAVDGHRVESPADVSELIRDHDEGDKVELSIIRERNEQQFSVEVGDLGVYGLGNWRLPTMPQIPRFDRFHSMPQLYWYDGEHGSHFRSEDLEDDMKELEEQMRKLEKQLRGIEKKLD